MASRNLQANLDKIQQWLKTWRIKANESKSIHVTFTMKKGNCSTVTLNRQQLKHADSAKYLGLHIDRRLNWQKHIFTKRKQLGLKLRKLYWMIGRKSQLSLENKMLIYKAIIKPIWTYGIELWGTASHSNIGILQRFQSKVLRIIVNAPWYVPNITIQRDLCVPSVKEEIQSYSAKYSKRVKVHPNKLAKRLMDEPNEPRRLKRFKPTDLPTRFI